MDNWDFIACDDQHDINTENLTKLRDYMRDVVLKNNRPFDMTTYMSISNDDSNDVVVEQLKQFENDVHGCKTSACLLGYAPLALNKPITVLIGEDLPSDMDDFYSEFLLRQFGIFDMTQLWDFLFGPVWSNDVQCAIDRLTYVIENKASPNYCFVTGEFEEFSYGK